ncbi:hypothetical protein [Flavobacterium celericrescens]|uniref:Lipoprotein n=1 Tax=Flavobacterium celericrescens TaxID=2709780 RepID=A0ABX0ID71_9FLAO|nr:hypothetical protein [Flavobacterium celericrescens]NHM05153.1 hypothetical protein [Flavobacterium celericrescens]
MKISIYNIIISSFIFSIFTSCIDKSNRQNQENKKVDKSIILEYKSQIGEYSGKEYFGTKSLYVKKISSPKKTTYVYRYEYYSRIDSLVFFNDSVKMNNENLLLLDNKFIKFKGKEIEIKKYQYTLDHPSNYFIVDSIGIIMEYGATHPSGTVTRQYSPDKYKELCNKIISDSTFYSLKFDFDHMKKMITKTATNSGLKQ